MPLDPWVPASTVLLQSEKAERAIRQDWKNNFGSRYGNQKPGQPVLSYMSELPDEFLDEDHQRKARFVNGDFSKAPPYDPSVRIQDPDDEKIRSRYPITLPNATIPGTLITARPGSSLSSFRSDPPFTPGSRLSSRVPSSQLSRRTTPVLTARKTPHSRARSVLSATLPSTRHPEPSRRHPADPHKEWLQGPSLKELRTYLDTLHKTTLHSSRSRVSRAH